MSEDLYAAPIHTSLIRPQLILGCDRELSILLILFVCLIAGPLGLMDGNFYSLPIAGIVWLIGQIFLVKLGKLDPLARKVFYASMKNKAWYPACAYAADGEDFSSGGLVKSCAGLLPYGALITPSIILLKDGSLLSGFEYTGDDLTTATQKQCAIVSQRAAVSLSSIGGGYTLHFETIRVPAPAYPTGNFSEIVTKAMDDERRQLHERDGAHFETRLFCFIAWQPLDAADKVADKAASAGAKIQAITQLFKKNKDVVQPTKEHLPITDEQLRRFEAAIDDFTNSFSVNFNVKPLRVDKLLNAIKLCITGKESNSPIPEVPWSLDTLFACEIENGEPFMFNNEYIKVIALDGFPRESVPSMLLYLGQLPFEYRWSSRFIPMDFREAYTLMTKEQKKWRQRQVSMLSQLFGRETTRVDKDAVTQTEDVNDAIAELQAGGVSYGHFTSVIIVRDLNYTTVEEKAHTVCRVLQECLFGTRVEGRNTLEAFRGSLPGDTHRNCRRPIVNTINLSHFLMLSSAWPGLKNNPCSFYPKNSPCLMQVSSTGNNPFRFNIHSSDIGHTLILGPTGSGKSTLLAELVAQFDRYSQKEAGANCQVFVFDKGRSMYPLISAIEDSCHYELGGDEDGEQPMELCPLSALETDEDIAWAANYIENLVLINEGEINPTKRKEINRALRDMASGTHSSSERSLTYFQVNLQDEDLKNALAPFVAGGTYGKYLDGTQTNIKYSRYTCFELDHLMTMGNQVTTPVLLYLFHEIQKRLDGRASLIVIDEAWIALASKEFSRQLAEWLRVLRKANCAVVLATQSLSQVLKSEIANDILESCPTRIMLANPEANSEAMQPLYVGRLMLTEAETDAIATAIPKREYFYISPEGKRKFNLNLGPVQLSFVGAAGKEDLKLVKQYKKRYGRLWPAEYLAKERGLPDWGEYLAQMYRKK